ncbi:hypothetical protein ACIOJD_05395 [Streptomyces sp. NPDC088116]
MMTGRRRVAPKARPLPSRGTPGLVAAWLLSVLLLIDACRRQV